MLRTQIWGQENTWLERRTRWKLKVEINRQHLLVWGGSLQLVTPTCNSHLTPVMTVRHTHYLLPPIYPLVIHLKSDAHIPKSFFWWCCASLAFLSRMEVLMAHFCTGVLPVTPFDLLISSQEQLWFMSTLLFSWHPTCWNKNLLLCIVSQNSEFFEITMVCT